MQPGMQPGGAAPEPAGIRSRVRRLATLRAAARALSEVADPGDAANALEVGAKLLRRLQALSGRTGRAEIVDPGGALRGVDELLRRLSRQLREVLLEADIPSLCAALAPLAREESGAIRALAAVALDGDLDPPRLLDLVELLVALLCCQGRPGARQIVRDPLDALPELAEVRVREAHESHPEIAEAQQIFGRAVMRLLRDDIGATRDRVRSYKQRLGARRLHPEVLAAVVAYDVAMANRLAELCEDDDSLDALAETVLGAEAADPEGAATVRRVRVPQLPAARENFRTRLFWHALATIGLSVCLLVLAVLLWQRPTVQVIAAESAVSISPHLVAGYLASDDGKLHFVGTVGESWDALPVAQRRLAVARIAARLEGDGVTSLTLMNARNAIQARHEGDTLLWMTMPE
jgi:hypothetical protein